jgi:hypothetical protein
MEPHLAEAVPAGISMPALLSIISAIGVAGAATITALWKVLHGNMDKAETRLTRKLDECEVKHSEANDQLLDLTKEVGELGGRMEGYNLARKDLQELSNEVLKIIRND